MCKFGFHSSAVYAETVPVSWPSLQMTSLGEQGWELQYSPNTGTVSIYNTAKS